MSKLLFLHISDLHLDSPFLSISHYPEAIRQELICAPIRSFEKLCKKAIEINASFILISGDIFDNPDVSLRIQEKFFSLLRLLSSYKIKAFIICGNHDYQFFQLHLSTLNNIEGIYFYEDEYKVVPIEVNDQKIEIYGSKYDTHAKLIKKEEIIETNSFKICLYHGDISNSKKEPLYANQNLSNLISLDIDYWALGHIHQYQILNKKPYVVYSGTPQGRSFKPSETMSKGGVLVEVEKLEVTRVEFIETSEICYSELKFSIEWSGNSHDFYLKLVHKINEEIEKSTLETSGKVILRLNIIVLIESGNFPLKAEIIELEELVSEKLFKFNNTQDCSIVDFIWDYHSKNISQVQEEIINISEKILNEEQFLFSSETQDELLKPKIKMSYLDSPDFFKIKSDTLKLINKLIIR